MNPSTAKCPVAPRMRSQTGIEAMKGKGSLAGKTLLGAAFLLCPCHLPVYLALLGGTAAGALLSDNAYAGAGVLTVAFLLTLLLGLRLLKARGLRPASTSLEKIPNV